MAAYTSGPLPKSRTPKSILYHLPMIIQKLIDRADLEKLALPSNLRYGQAIYKRGGVELIESSDSKIEAWVGGLDGSMAEGGGTRCRTTLTSSEKGLHWHCTGNSKDHMIFCKHCVALALFIKHQD